MKKRSRRKRWPVKRRSRMDYRNALFRGSRNGYQAALRMSRPYFFRPIKRP